MGTTSDQLILESAHHGRYYTPPRLERIQLRDVKQNGMEWVQTRLPSAGASQFAVDTLSLAGKTIIAAGIIPLMNNGRGWATEEQPLVYPNIMAPLAGLGGVIQGQFLSQPLYDPYNGTYGALVSA